MKDILGINLKICLNLNCGWQWRCEIKPDNKKTLWKQKYLLPKKKQNLDLQLLQIRGKRKDLSKSMLKTLSWYGKVVTDSI